MKLRPYQDETLDIIKAKLKEHTKPLLVTMSVGAGKSIIIAKLLEYIQQYSFKALCLTMNSTLISQNAALYKQQCGECGIYCAGLNEKDTTNNIIFASPHSVAISVKARDSIADIRFNLIVIDECHNIAHTQKDSMYMRILNWYGYQAQLNNYSFRVLGLTGTPYRGKGISIVGKDEYFHTEIINISTSWLIEHGYLTKPHFGITSTKSFDFSQLRVNNMGNFNGKELQEVINKNERLTAEIMREVVSVVENGHRGAFIFCSTVAHCHEAFRALPEGQAAIITGDTKHEERHRVLESARRFHITYLLSVGCLNTGVDVAGFDVCAWLRPTESLVLYTQGIGRVLRLYPGKSEAIVLDYAGNLERHGHIDDPIINEALQPKPETEKDYCIPCYQCNTNNLLTARRCIGMPNNKRCDYYFDFKECPTCKTPNDITARQCRECHQELIDPNAKLTKLSNAPIFHQVLKAQYWLTKDCTVYAKYITNNGYYIESFATSSTKAQQVFYAQFMKYQIPNYSQFYLDIGKYARMNTMIYDRIIKTPFGIDVDSHCKIKKKYFHDTP